MGLIAELGAGRVAVDTTIFIYFIEEHPRFLPAIVPRLPPVPGLRILELASYVK